MEFTIEENKKRQVDVDVDPINTKENVKLYIHIYKANKMLDAKRLTFSDRERCMIHIENLIKTTDYNLTGFSSDDSDGFFNERYFITLKK